MVEKSAKFYIFQEEFIMGKMKELDIKVKEVKDRVVRFAKENRNILIASAVGGIVEIVTKAYFVGKDGVSFKLGNSKNAGKIDDAIDRLGENSDDMKIALGGYRADVLILTDAENKNSGAAFNRIDRIENGLSVSAGLGAAGLTYKVLNEIWPDGN